MMRYFWFYFYNFYENLMHYILLNTKLISNQGTLICVFLDKSDYIFLLRLPQVV